MRYKIFADYHTHTINSHGKGTIRQNVEVAIQKGLKEIAITDHGPGHLTYGVKRGYLERMRNEINELNKEYQNINILLGVEANLVGVNGEIDVNETDLKFVDKLLLGFHNGAMPSNISSAWKLYLRNYLARIVPFLRQSSRKINTDAMIKAIQKNKVDIITHPGAKIDIDTKRLAVEATKRGTVLEINSSHGFLSAEYAKIAFEEGASFVIDSDAHVPENVGNFDKGIEIAKAAGIPINKIVNAELE